MKIKEFIGCEIARNKQNAVMYTAIMRQAFGKDNPVLIGHHLCFEVGLDINTENEIPSADTLMFDHEIMGAVFGNQAIEVMMHLARTPTESRDLVLEMYFKGIDPVTEVYLRSGFETTPIPANMDAEMVRAYAVRKWPGAMNSPVAQAIQAVSVQS